MSSRVQMYLEKHKIPSLFEELMNKVIRDSPENPIAYLIKQLYRKAGLSIPLELKSNSSLSKTAPDFTIHGQSSEIVSKSTVLASWSRKSDEFRAASAPMSKDKSYVKGWQQKEKPKPSSHPKKPTEADSVDLTETVKPKISQVSPIPHSKKKTSARTAALIYPRHASLDDFMQTKKTTADHKEKPTWNGDTKIKPGSSDGSGAETKANGLKSSKSLKSESTSQVQDPRKSWAMIGLNDGAGDSFQDGCYTGPKVTRRVKTEEADILAEEMVMSSRHKYFKEEPAKNTSVHTGRISSKQAIVEKRKENLEKLLKEKENVAPVSSKTAVDTGYEDADSAIELLENPEDLISEGVNKMPPAGYRLSKTLRHREEDSQVKLNINLYSGAAPSEIGSAISHFEEFSEYDQESIGRRTPATNHLVRFDDSDDDFDSASQVTSSSQRMPHWEAKHLDAETYSLGRTPSPHQPPLESHKFLSKSVTIQEPTRTNSPTTSRLRLSAPPLSASTPAALRTSTNSENLSINSALSHKGEQSVSNSQNLADLLTASRGWEISDDSDGSILSAHSTRRKLKKLPKAGNK